MASSVSFSTIGFFNNQWPLTQVNWASYFSPMIPDGVIAGIDDELEVYASSSGMYVYVKPGECRARSHRGALDEITALDIAAADASHPRIDLVVARVTYGSPSAMTIAVKTGTPAATPSCPTVTQTAGSVWEIPLAEVYVAANAATIAAADVTDRRYVYHSSGSAATSFSGTSLTVANDWEYRNDTEIGSLAIELPASPSNVFICGVCFTASSSFTGVTFTQGGNAYTVKTTDGLNFKSVRYNMVIWWDGSYFWCSARAV